MKYLTVLFILLFSSSAYSDCTAPDLKFAKHTGEIQGFKVVKLWDKLEKDELAKPGDTFIEYGSYGYLLSPVNSGRKVKKLDVDTGEIKDLLLGNLIRGEFYLDPMEQTYEVLNIIVYDLSENAKPDLVLFQVSPGANVYSGAVGIIAGEWKTLVTPMCY